MRARIVFLAVTVALLSAGLRAQAQTVGDPTNGGSVKPAGPDANPTIAVSWRLPSNWLPLRALFNHVIPQPRQQSPVRGRTLRRTVARR
ncbi:MAG TPA: hypothetical protein VFI79_04655 [Gemmatimonadales bacterium]|nr:hypothetical protein [Gemmatimonadales bacterium]